MDWLFTRLASPSLANPSIVGGIPGGVIEANKSIVSLQCVFFVHYVMACLYGHDVLVYRSPFHLPHLLLLPTAFILSLNPVPSRPGNLMAMPWNHRGGKQGK